MNTALTALTSTTAAGEPLTMTSKEIAELTGKEHKHVIRDIQSMLLELVRGDGPVLGHPTLESIAAALPGVRAERDGRNYVSCIHLPKDLTLTLVAGYNVVLRKRIVTRWMELESAPAFALPNFANPAEAARAWAVPGEAAAVTVGPIQHWKGFTRIAGAVSHSSVMRRLPPAIGPHRHPADSTSPD